MFAHQPFPKIEVKPELHDRLNRILTQYQALANSDPQQLRKLIPPTELWRFFIDGIMQKKESWLGFEGREAGYLKGMYTAFQSLFDSSAELNVDLIKQLHRHAIKRVKKTNYSQERSLDEIGEFRDNHREGAFYVVKYKERKNFTKAGLLQFLNEHHSEINFSIQFYFLNEKSTVNFDFPLTDACLESIRQHVTSRLQAQKPIQFTDAYNALRLYIDSTVRQSFLNTHSCFHSRFTEIIHAIGLTRNNEELADCLHCILSSPRYHTAFAMLIVSTQPRPVRQILNHEIQARIDRYKYSLTHYTNPMDKLIATLYFIQSCEQIHAFRDANCRTLCMLLFPFLLKNNGFPIALMKDPNRFDVFDTLSLLHEVLNGMENTFQLIETGQVFNVTTDGILRKAKRSQVKYFQTCANIEESNRAQPAKRQRSMQPEPH